ncbi:ABC transporter ATP-binding protein [Herbivorax sp. ANBcel31]|uniref:ABC transporter ATP-binding protein n=1 Tax=Herbivorax sp. ANBcel31 TaxID=3069754 RepID=UPI0027B71AA7|nr:ABC transporter ATP-binding protein [Herbivorax sp. ANBcel31]MDQ2087988.1 ABC transporter ATP-binding protein [Herbivorax sp. ANBcel31]
MIKISNVTKQYKNGYVANSNITLSVEPGEVFGLLGPNGAGKTTLVNQLIGLTKPTSGEITIDGTDIVANPATARRLCSFQPQSQIPIDGLSPIEAIELTGRIRGIDKKFARRRAMELIERLQLKQWAKTRGENLSGGVRRLTAFCMTCVAPSKVVIFDEPTNDVDPERRRLLWKEIQNLSDKGLTIILVTHNVLEAERSTDRLAIIHKSELIRQGTPSSFRNNGEDHMILELTLEVGKSTDSIQGIESNAVQTGRRVFQPIKMSKVSQWVKWANELRNNRLIEEFSINPPSLEESYLQIVGAVGYDNGLENQSNNLKEEQ